MIPDDTSNIIPSVHGSNKRAKPMKSRRIGPGESRDTQFKLKTSTQHIDPCQRSSSPPLSVERHAYALGILLREPDFDPEFSGWFDVGEWLVLSAGIRHLSIVTNGLDEGDAMCSNPYEEERGMAASYVATELARLLFIWGAVDRLMAYALKGKANPQDEGLPRRFSRHIGTKQLALQHQECAASNLLLYLDRHDSHSFEDIGTDAKKLRGTVVSQGVFAASRVRNALSHGSIPWPDARGRSAELGVRIGRMASRVLLFAIQSVAADAVSPAARTPEWSDENEGYEFVLVKGLLPHVHLAK